jgi:hypothetical protein
MQFAGHAPPLVLLRSKELAANTPPLPLETNEFGYVMDADENVPRSVDRQRGNDDVEIVTVEGSAAFVQVSKNTPRAGANISKGPQDRFDAFVAVFDQAFQERDIVTAYVKSGARLSLDLSAPPVVDC